MNRLLSTREARGLSQRKLAAKSGVSYKTVQLLESGPRNPRWSTLVKLAKTLALEPAQLAAGLTPGQGPAADTARGCSQKIARDGEPSWKIHLMDMADDLRRDPSPGRMAEAPDPEAGPRMLALIAATVEALCAETGLRPPWWCAGVGPLNEPWFVSEVENLKASALVESPAQFRQRNVFVLANFLSRA